MASFDIDNQAAASIAVPPTGVSTLFVDNDKNLKLKDDTGAVKDYGAASSGISQLTGDVLATGPGVSAATIPSAVATAKLLTGLVASGGVISAADNILQAFGKLVNKQNSSVYPNKTPDGDVVIAANTTLVRDMYYNSLTVNLGAVLFTNGFRIFAQSIICNGTIDRSGADATGTGGTGALVAGTIGAAGAGGAGGTAAGAAGGASSSSLGGSAGAGGLGSSGAGGSAGALTLVSAAQGGVELLNDVDRARIAQTTTNLVVSGGAGGGGGGGDLTAGGAGGAGGAALLLIARSITGAGSIISKGGNGFQPLAGNRGGGGGGGGGVIVTISENDITLTGLTISVVGGTGASGSGTGASGLNGTNGRQYLLNA